MHPRDACILTLARRLAGPRPTFADAVGALSAAVTRIIPAGRVFVIGTTSDGPIVGSAISGIGIAPHAHEVAIVRVGADGRALHLDAWLARHTLARHTLVLDAPPTLAPPTHALHAPPTHAPHALAPSALALHAPPTLAPPTLALHADPAASPSHDVARDEVRASPPRSEARGHA
jgi:hypothetical protein